MNSILQRWHEAGLHSVQAIREGDRPSQQRQRAGEAAPAAADKPSAREMERMRRLLEKMNG